MIQRNSLDVACIEDLAELKKDLRKSGHGEEALEETELKAAQRAIENELYGPDHPTTNKTVDGKLVYSVKYFHDIGQLKRLVHSVRDDITQFLGETKITFALRKQPSIGSTVVRTRKLSDAPQLEDLLGETIKNQKCHGRGCITCYSDDKITVNGQDLSLDFNLTCKSKNVIYVAQCQLCTNSTYKLKEDCYFGQTLTPFHVRMNGHRSKFKINSTLDYEKSALSVHCYTKHRVNFSMEVLNWVLLNMLGLEI